ncbi:hypothetical protein A3F03_02270 [Candidatus Roizmanbacteria bacterium RIFCSPHIGHO2_12_FULL_41_11]|uniref:Peptidase M20 dimerisation domain-containing protein n=3 Tax=Candidatus Roizmaniibacteriota TaxID=1752723 RepID=A0A1F7JQP1_9BACT|nr:MAG: hypothetical protein A3F03_02270 [Candidatus Roizmanbacteria bacterium RIFCSPHIGHO2_12_FULL_41_11]OGK51658.1 MAG: hypothetical protein A2966_05020 [Candidatus Roizmanbacteria bacterium RIFCSPLOWO2_01_FULL_41_22]OGK57917.1 MAG: hypothetical protein A3H86_01600 [Candidatus Roizmanbacteria bacterium RIFCSPLOWO2_02_FULL_41_9]
MDRQKILTNLNNFLSIQSISADPSYSSSISSAVEFLQNQLDHLGFQVKIIRSGHSTPPLIVAVREVSSSAKTIGIYGHYDVQPADPLSQWHYPPFRLTVKDGKMYGRGIADNKGHIIQNLSALQELITTNKLTNNLVVFFEGEEETGSLHLEKLLKKAKKYILKADTFFITDTGLFAKGITQIFYALRGLVYLELKVQVAEHDLHSGLYGNQIINPILAIAHLLSKIKDSVTGDILIPNFYQNLRKIPAKELNLLKKVKRSVDNIKTISGAYQIISARQLPSYLVTKILPSFDVHGINGGYSGEGAKTIIPSTASVKFSFRLVENQTVKEIEQKIRLFVKANLPQGVRFDLKTLSADEPFYTNLDNFFVQKTAALLSDHFGNKTLFNRSGGSIPAAEILQRLFQKPIILTGFTLPDDNIHAPNENYDEEMFWSGIEALKKIYG